MGRPKNSKPGAVDKAGWENITLKVSPEVGDALRFQALHSRQDMGVIADGILRAALAEALRVLSGLPKEIAIQAIPAVPSHAPEAHTVPGDDEAARADVQTSVMESGGISAQPPEPMQPGTQVSSPAAAVQNNQPISLERRQVLTQRVAEWDRRFLDELLAHFRKDWDNETLLERVAEFSEAIDNAKITPAKARRILQGWNARGRMPDRWKEFLWGSFSGRNGFRSTVFDEGVTPEEFFSLGGD